MICSCFASEALRKMEWRDVRKEGATHKYMVITYDNTSNRDRPIRPIRKSNVVRSVSANLTRSVQARGSEGSLKRRLNKRSGLKPSNFAPVGT